MKQRPKNVESWATSWSLFQFVPGIISNEFSFTVKFNDVNGYVSYYSFLPDLRLGSEFSIPFPSYVSGDSRIQIGVTGKDHPVDSACGCGGGEGYVRCLLFLVLTKNICEKGYQSGCVSGYSMFWTGCDECVLEEPKHSKFDPAFLNGELVRFYVNRKEGFVEVFRNGVSKGVFGQDDWGKCKFPTELFISVFVDGYSTLFAAFELVEVIDHEEDLKFLERKKREEEKLMKQIIKDYPLLKRTVQKQTEEIKELKLANKRLVQDLTKEREARKLEIEELRRRI